MINECKKNKIKFKSQHAEGSKTVTEEAQNVKFRQENPERRHSSTKVFSLYLSSNVCKPKAIEAGSI